MYTSHKQISIEQELNSILSLVRFKNFIDKADIQNLLKCSEKTSERRLNKLNLTHMKNTLIDCLIDYENGIETKILAERLNCSEVNINALAKRHNISRPIGFRNVLKSDFEFFDNINTEEKAYILRIFCC